ncbi:glycosyltransferase family 2 protein [Candidatus Electronema sp. PJ]|uniref:glycosyltransferase family 2 protein n=1 Tax=Candidatus Electronema sp. PJ TaxID=3401572 RepID=UPI003AA7ED65
MRFSIITPNYNGGRFLEQTISSVISQTSAGLELEYIVVDGGSSDCSHEILARYKGKINQTIIEKDRGPANAINKGLALASGEVLAWLNADDIYYPDTLQRVQQALQNHPEAAICFGHCPIIDAQSKEIRLGITRFKELFYPLSSRFTYQCINYLSQPSLFFRRSAFAQAGFLREDLQAAWDYDFILRLWRSGGAVQVPNAPLAAFRWHEQSISGQHFRRQFQEEYEAAQADAGRLAPQTLLHFFVRWGIVGMYSLMAWKRTYSKGQ